MCPHAPQTPVVHTQRWGTQGQRTRVSREERLTETSHRGVWTHHRPKGSRCPHLPAKRKTEAQPPGTPAPGSCRRKELWERSCAEGSLVTLWQGVWRKDAAVPFTNTSIPTQVVAKTGWRSVTTALADKTCCSGLGEAGQTFIARRGMWAPNQEGWTRCGEMRASFPPLLTPKGNLCRDSSFSCQFLTCNSQ